LDALAYSVPFINRRLAKINAGAKSRQVKVCLNIGKFIGQLSPCRHIRRFPKKSPP